MRRKRFGALRLVVRRLSEASGVRQRKILATGLEALAPSERRVAQMAADGMRNREIAQALFVRVKTVEGHLTNALYQARRSLARGSRGGSLR